MKINPISFGQTYLSPTLKYLSPENQEKLKHSYPLGQIYPNDIYLGATKRGDLTVQITTTTALKNLLVNNLIPINKDILSLYLLEKRLDEKYMQVHGPKYPIAKSVIKSLDYISEDELVYHIASEVEAYNKKYGHLFFN